ncbi:MAG: type IX secretion system sortase PorU [Bacteroidales bacterium]|nr:type IX secretion system sortase PorU [Bacteroidales bacterium]
MKAADAESHSTGIRRYLKHSTLMNLARTNINSLILTLCVLLGFAQNALALPTDTYRSESALAGGNWVKISVKESGIHFLSVAELRRMGFTDPSKVSVHGYGAMRLPDLLDASYIDDLPQAQSVATDRGIYFYAVGPTAIKASSDMRLTQSQNPFTTLGYYYLTDSADSRRGPDAQVSASGNEHATTAQSIVYHETDLINPGETGHDMLGEDFLSNTSKVFNMSLPHRVEGTSVWMECAFHALSPAASRIVLSVNDKALPYISTDQINGSSDSYTHSVPAVTRRDFEMEGTTARVSVTHSRTTTPRLARLNYLTLNYTRSLALADGAFDFFLRDLGGSLSGADATTHVWDITDPQNIIAMTTSQADGRLQWLPPAEGIRHYAAWSESNRLPSPTVVGRVANQNIHGEEVPDMVIFTPADWISEAERVAQLHRQSVDSLRVLVVDVADVYNEFSSGSPDINAFRKLLKMFWDRSEAGAPHRLRYAILMGRSSFDNRRLMSTTQALGYPLLPSWQSDNSLSDNSSYTSDDILTMLADKSGLQPEADYQCISVGRMPVTSLADARTVVDKLVAYVNSPINSGWKNRAIMVADDQNQGKFIYHTEKQIENAMQTQGGRNIMFQKVYLDAYERRNSTYPGARNDMFRMLTEGAIWWNFAGHANPSSWTGDGLMTYTDINNLYIKHYPFTVAATCDFLRWDSHTISAAEILYRTPGSGIIGAISATRPALIDRNGVFLDHLGDHMFALDEDGRNLTIGEIYRRTKNNSKTTGTWRDSNKLRYVLMGDPALRLATPSRRVILESINGVEPILDNQPTMMASQDIRLKGYIADENGNCIDDFNGRVTLTLYDAEYSTTSHGYGDGERVTFEQQGTRLQEKIDSVRSGRFETTLVMPSDIAHNFRPAALNMYAVDANGCDASSINREFYVFGVDENAVADDTAPIIEEFFLNHSSFSDGDIVNTTPVVIARISDNRSINLSSAGIGHSMLLTIDGRSLTDTPLYYTPFSDGTPGGTIVYQLESLAEGTHNLRLRIWDTAGNSATESFDFTVSHNADPRLYQLYADANPAPVSTNFYLTHDRPDALITVDIEVFDLLGRPIWSSTSTGMSDTLRSFPVNWNLTDKAGRRVGRGIYLYRARITDSEGNTSATETRRIAVTAP